MVSGGVLVIWQGDMLVWLPGGPSPVLRMNFIHPHQSYLVTPMQWVMWAAVKIKIVYVFGAKATAYADFILWKLVWKWATPILIWKNIILPIHLSQWPFSGPEKTHFQTDPNIISSWWDIYIYIPFLLLVLSHPSEKSISRISIMINICTVSSLYLHSIA